MADSRCGSCSAVAMETGAAVLQAQIESWEKKRGKKRQRRGDFSWNEGERQSLQLQTQMQVFQDHCITYKQNISGHLIVLMNVFIFVNKYKKNICLQCLGGVLVLPSLKHHGLLLRRFMLYAYILGDSSQWSQRPPLNAHYRSGPPGGDGEVMCFSHESTRGNFITNTSSSFSNSSVI